MSRFVAFCGALSELMCICAIIGCQDPAAAPKSARVILTIICAVTVMAIRYMTYRGIK